MPANVSSASASSPDSSEAKAAGSSSTCFANLATPPCEATKVRTPKRNTGVSPSSWYSSTDNWRYPIASSQFLANLSMQYSRQSPISLIGVPPDIPANTSWHGECPVAAMTYRRRKATGQPYFHESIPTGRKNRAMARELIKNNHSARVFTRLHVRKRLVNLLKPIVTRDELI